MKITILDFLTYLDPLACIAALVIMHQRKQLRQFGFLVAFLFVRIFSAAIFLPLFHLIQTHAIEAHRGYRIYFYFYWSSYALQAVLGFGIIFSLYKLAMAPLPGLQRLGRVMFRWAGGIALALAVSAAIGPNMGSQKMIQRSVHQLQQTQSILTLCMLLFVCLASKPMGLSHRSKIFGVSLGLGVFAASDLVTSAWIPTSQQMNSVIEILNQAAIVLALSIWVGYFAIPEPRRRMIVLPTTSPFLRWNQISLALGDEPGFVAIGDVTPDMFAPAEVEFMRRASVRMNAASEGSETGQPQQVPMEVHSGPGTARMKNSIPLIA